MPDAEIPDTGARILAAALALFAEGGSAAVTIRALGERAAASTGSIYHFFSSREGVLGALYFECLEHYRSGLRRRVAEAASARRFVRGIVLHHLEWSAREPARARFLHQLRRSDALAESDAELRASTQQFPKELFVRAEHFIERGQLRALPKDAYLPLLLGPARELVHLHAAGRTRGDIDDLAEVLADAAWRALGTEAEGEPS